MKVKLIVVAGKTSKRRIAFSPPIIIGRGGDADLTVVHPMISRLHCQVFEVDGLLMVRDLGSLNGTCVGGLRIKEAPLCPDAEFTVGPLIFRVQYQYDGDLDSVPAPLAAGQEQEEEQQPDTETEDAPDFQTVGQQQPSDGADLDEIAMDFLTEAAEKEELEEEEEEEEGELEPTPPPTLQGPAKKKAVAEPAVEEIADEEIIDLTEEEIDVAEDEPEPRPPLLPEPLAAREPAVADKSRASKKKKQKKKEKHPDGTPEVPAGMDFGDQPSPAPVQTEDDDLNKFLKGLGE